MDTLTIQKGQWVPLRFTFWADTAKTLAVDLTGATVTVCKASQQALVDLMPELTDAPNGIVDLTLLEEQSRQLNSGRVNWMQLEAQFVDDKNILTPRIWINANE